MDYHPKKEDQYRVQYPPVGCSQKDNREVQRHDKGQQSVPYAEQYHLQQDTERNRQTVRLQDTVKHTRCKTHERHDRTFIQRCTD